jgi:hypothetical protein
MPTCLGALTVVALGMAVLMALQLAVLAAINKGHWCCHAWQTGSLACGSRAAGEVGIKPGVAAVCHGCLKLLVSGDEAGCWLPWLRSAHVQQSEVLDQLKLKVRQPGQAQGPSVQLVQHSWQKPGWQYSSG